MEECIDVMVHTLVGRGAYVAQHRHLHNTRLHVLQNEGRGSDFALLMCAPYAYIPF